MLQSTDTKEVFFYNLLGWWKKISWSKGKSFEAEYITWVFFVVILETFPVKKPTKALTHLRWRMWKNYYFVVGDVRLQLRFRRKGIVQHFGNYTHLLFYWELDENIDTTLILIWSYSQVTVVLA